jgi:hypothetical protein
MLRKAKSENKQNLTTITSLNYIYYTRGSQPAVNMHFYNTASFCIMNK